MAGLSSLLRVAARLQSSLTTTRSSLVEMDMLTFLVSTPPSFQPHPHSKLTLQKYTLTISQPKTWEDTSVQTSGLDDCT